MQIRDRESNDETWPRKTPGPPKPYRFIDPKIRIEIARSLGAVGNPDDRIEELGEPVNEHLD